MICATPYGPYPCGKCDPCRVNRQRLWSARIVLEAMDHPASIFCTLTYSDETVPAELRPSDLQKFLKRLRLRAGKPLRFYAAGEYGSKTLRPHFHVIIFGLSLLDHAVVEAAWNNPDHHGFVHVGNLTEASAAYVAKYCTKGLDRADAPELKGKHPEFSRMSLRPHGLGWKAAERIGEALATAGPSAAVAEIGDVPAELRVTGQRYPLGRYLRQRLRSSIGWGDKTPAAIIREISFAASMEPLELVEEKRRVSQIAARSRIDIAASKRKFS